uniref:Uncharacterized protein n=1 Tax=Cucumis sativus TaxID=3659 RepID=A0A0A0K399_CUCSA
MKSMMSSTTIWEEKMLHLPNATTIATKVAASVPMVIASSAATNLLMIRPWLMYNLKPKV